MVLLWWCLCVSMLFWCRLQLICDCRWSSHLTRTEKNHQPWLSWVMPFSEPWFDWSFGDRYRVYHLNPSQLCRSCKSWIAEVESPRTTHGNPHATLQFQSKVFVKVPKTQLCKIKRGALRPWPKKLKECNPLLNVDSNLLSNLWEVLCLH